MTAPLPEEERVSVQPKSKSFFSTTAGVITGAAGVLTAVVGILGAATQLGWIGSKGDSPTTPTTTAVSTPATANPGVGGLVPTTASPSGRSSPSPTSANARFDVSPTALEFSGNGDKVVTVKNNGTNTIAFEPPAITGVNSRNFTATPSDTGTCSRLDAGRSCQIKVTFTSSGLGQYTAVLAIKPSGGIAQEVSLKASAVL